MVTPSSQPIYEFTDVWNEGATVFAGIGMDVTDTASAAESDLINLKVGGSSRFRVRKDGLAFVDDISTSQESSLNQALDDRQLKSDKGQPNGYAPLDASGQVPTQHIPISGMSIQGPWSAATNTPTLSNGTGTVGHAYWATDSGTVDFGAGPISFTEGDFVIYTAANIWERIPASAPVQSVFGRIGAVVAESGDYAAFYDAIGSAAAVQANLGTHEARQDNPHNVTAGQIGAIQGPGSSVDDEVLTFNGTSGDSVQGVSGTRATPGLLVVTASGGAGNLQFHNTDGTPQFQATYSQSSSLSQLSANTRLELRALGGNLELEAPSNEILVDKDPTSPLGVMTKQLFDAHAGDATIHFPDAPADNRVYGRRNNAWIKLSQIGGLNGTPGNFSPGASPTPVTSWPNSFATGVFESDPPDIALGIITAPETGVYRVTVKIVGEQSNSNKELSILYWLLSDLQPDLIFDAMDVATDKTTWRTGGGSFLQSFTAGEELRVAVSRIDQSIGTYQMAPCSFELEFIRDLS